MELNNKYIIKDIKLGSGSFSEVYLGLNLLNNNDVAIKIVCLNDKKDILHKLEKEIFIMQKMDHPNIVKYYDVIKTDTKWYIIWNIVILVH